MASSLIKSDGLQELLCEGVSSTTVIKIGTGMHSRLGVLDIVSSRSTMRKEASCVCDVYSSKCAT